MRTLDHWTRLLGREPKTIECSNMRLAGYDFEPDVFVGPGRIELDGGQNIRFKMYGTTTDAGMAFRKMLKAHEHPYDHLEQFRLFATDYEGNEWAGGFTEVEHFADHQHGWPMSGELQGLSTQVSGAWVSKESSVELLFDPPVDLPLSKWRATVTKIGDEEIGWSREPGQERVEVLDTEILFEADQHRRAFWIIANTSNRLPHPFAERWLSEPLRILLGALLCPRLTARNFGEGRAFVTLLPAPPKVVPSAFGLMQPFGFGPDHTVEFWRLYADILTMISFEESEGAHPLEDHVVSRLYTELAQAQRGSRWVIMLTLASMIEALAKVLMTEDDKHADFHSVDLEEMEKLLKSWSGDDALGKRMLSNFAMVRNRSVPSFLRGLAHAQKLDKSHVNTWQKLRNSVMHGEMVEPWSTAEGDQHMQELVALVHALTRLRIAKV